jgi:4'-phosphopantetheinyl transferase
VSARHKQVGIDLEFIREDFAGFEIAERFFSSRAGSALRALSEGERVDALFDCRVRKEAYIKARGEGLSHPLRTFTVSLKPGEPAALLHTEGDSREGARWSLAGLYPFEGYYRAALAVEGEPPSMCCWRWP